MRPLMKWSCGWGVAVVLALATVGSTAGAGEAPNRGGKEKRQESDSVLFLTPVADLIKPEAGTVEVDFILDYSFDDYLRPGESFCQPFVFLYILDRNNPTNKQDDSRPIITLSLHQGRGQHCIAFGCNWSCTVQKDTNKRATIAFARYGNQDRGPWFKRGERHSLAATWSTEAGVSNWEFFIDGLSCWKDRFADKPDDVRALGENDLIQIGGTSLSPATILGYRISSRARTAAEIAPNKTLKPDDSTTLFLDAKTIGEQGKMDRKEYQKMVQAGKLTMRKGTFIGKFRLVDTPHGKGIQFFSKQSR